MTISVQIGDITTVPAEGLITAVNSQGMWAGASLEEGVLVHRWLTQNPNSVDGAIQCVAGGQFHSQALILLDQAEGQTLVAGTQRPHPGAFHNVVFVVDDLNGPLYSVLMAGLVAADQAGLNSVSVAAMRTGNAHHSGSLQQKAEELVRAARDFQSRARHLRQMVFVLSRQGPLAHSLRTALHLPAPAYQVKVLLGDITAVPSEAVITAVNSEGMWGGGIDRAIYGVAGQQYHRSARILLGKPDGHTLVASAQHDHQGAFSKVVFVVDDLGEPLYDILTAGLRAADQAGLKVVTVPAMRMGVMMSMGGPPHSKIADMARAARDFRDKAQSLRKVIFVVYGDPIACEALKAELA